MALPFRRLALGRARPGARHRDLDRPECACQRPRAATVAVARNAGFSFIAGHLASLVTPSRQHGVKFAADHFFDELTRSNPYLSLARNEPAFEKAGNWLCCCIRGTLLR